MNRIGVQMQVLPLNSYVTSGKLVHFSELRFSHLYNRRGDIEPMVCWGD